MEVGWDSGSIWHIEFGFGIGIGIGFGSGFGFGVGGMGTFTNRVLVSLNKLFFCFSL